MSSPIVSQKESLEILNPAELLELEVSLEQVYCKMNMQNASRL
jgi:hypothetical protein